MTTQVIGQEITAAGVGIPGVTVIARLVAPYGFLKEDPTGQDVIKRAEAVTDSDGNWSLDLTPTAEYLYEGSYYDIAIGSGDVYPIAVPVSEDALILRDLLINPPNPGDVYIPVVGTKGDPGPANELSIGTVQGADEAAATITGTSPHQVLNLDLPKGDPGEQGEIGDTGPAIALAIGNVTITPPDELATAAVRQNPDDPNDYLLDYTFPSGVPGESAYDIWLAAGNEGTEATYLASLKGATGDAGPANNLSIGTVSSGDNAAASVTGQSPNQQLNFTLPQGEQGDPGQDGPPNTLTINSVTTSDPGGDASVTISGVSPNQVIDVVLPRGEEGPEGPAGDTSSFMPKISDPIPNRMVRVDSNGDLVQIALDYTTVTTQLGQIAGKADSSSLSTVATSGSYTDLSNKPTLSTVSATGSYTDLLNKPTISTVGASGQYGDLIGAPSLADVATSGSYTDLTDQPDIPVQYSDLTGTVPTSALPALAISQPFVVADEAAMLALTAQRGDVAIRTDSGRTYILSTDSPSTLADWIEISTPNAVNSVNGQTGTVVLGVADISGAASTTALTNYQLLSGKNAANGYAGLNGSSQLSSGQIPDLSATYLTVDYTAPVVSVNGATGEVVLDASDVGALSESYVPDWTSLTGKPTFATVATSGDYDDLLNLPSLSTVATSGLYSDLTGTPDLGDYQLLSEKDQNNGYAGLGATGKLSGTLIPDLSGSYLTVSYVPTWTSITGKPSTFAPIIGTTSTTALAGDTALFSGDYDDLTSKPTIPSTAAEVGALPDTYAPAAADISDATSVGRNVLTAADAAAARTAIGAGTSTLALGTTSTTALAGDTAIPNSPDDIGAATAAQGALADSAIQAGPLATALAAKVDKLRTDTTDPGAPLLEYHRQYATDSGNTDLIRVYNAGQDGTHPEALVSWMNEWGGWRFQIPEAEKFDAAIRIISSSGTKTQPFFQVQNNARTQNLMDIQSDGSIRTGVTKDVSGNWTVVGGVTLTVAGVVTGASATFSGNVGAANLPAMSGVDGGWKLSFGGKSLWLTDTDPDDDAADGDYWLP